MIGRRTFSEGPLASKHLGMMLSHPSLSFDLVKIEFWRPLPFSYHFLVEPSTKARPFTRAFGLDVVETFAIRQSLSIWAKSAHAIAPKLFVLKMVSMTTGRGLQR